MVTTDNVGAAKVSLGEINRSRVDVVFVSSLHYLLKGQKRVGDVALDLAMMANVDARCAFKCELICIWFL